MSDSDASKLFASEGAFVIIDDIASDILPSTRPDLDHSCIVIDVEVGENSILVGHVWLLQSVAVVKQIVYAAHDRSWNLRVSGVRDVMPIDNQPGSPKWIVGTIELEVPATISVMAENRVMN